jgi:hypothetical protein
VTVLPSSLVTAPTILAQYLWNVRIEKPRWERGQRKGIVRKEEGKEKEVFVNVVLTMKTNHFFRSHEHFGKVRHDELMHDLAKF